VLALGYRFTILDYGARGLRSNWHVASAAGRLVQNVHDSSMLNGEPSATHQYGSRVVTGGGGGAGAGGTRPGGGWGDYCVSVTLFPDTGSSDGGIGVVLRHLDARNHYRVSLVRLAGNHVVVLWKYVAGRRVELRRHQLSTLPSEYPIKVCAAGPYFAVYKKTGVSTQDLVLAYADLHDGAKAGSYIASGGVGLSCSGRTCQFDDFSIGPTQAPLSVSPSRVLVPEATGAATFTVSVSKWLREVAVKTGTNRVRVRVRAGTDVRVTSDNGDIVSSHEDLGDGNADNEWTKQITLVAAQAQGRALPTATLVVAALAAPALRGTAGQAVAVGAGELNLARMGGWSDLPCGASVAPDSPDGKGNDAANGADTGGGTGGGAGTSVSIYSAHAVSKTMDWKGAAAFCARAGRFRVCRYAEYCPSGSGQAPAQGSVSTTEEAWAPIGDAPDAWVSLATQTQCQSTIGTVAADVDAWSKDAVTPRSQKGHVYCCPLDDVPSTHIPTGSHRHEFITSKSGASRSGRLHGHGTTRTTSATHMFRCQAAQVRVEIMPAATATLPGPTQVATQWSTSETVQLRWDAPALRATGSDTSAVITGFMVRRAMQIAGGSEGSSVTRFFPLGTTAVTTVTLVDSAAKKYQFEDGGLISETTYLYEVAAVTGGAGGGGSSVSGGGTIGAFSSPPHAVRTSDRGPPLPPAKPLLVSQTGGTVQLRWKAAT
jgi:hypothetical protein